MSVNARERKLTAERIRSARTAARFRLHHAALHSAEEILRERPNSPGVRRLAIRLAITIGDRTRALAHTRLGVLLHPVRPDFLIAYAQLELASGRVGDARRRLSGIVATSARTGRGARSVRRLAAAIHAASGRPGLAASFAETGMRRRSGGHLRARVAELLRRGGKHDDAMRLIRSLTVPPRLLRARVLEGLGRWSEAADAYAELCDHPSSADAIADELRVTHEGDPGDPEDMIEFALVDATLSRIELLRRLGDRARLLNLALAELDTPADEPVVRLALAEALLEFGEWWTAGRLARRKGAGRPHWNSNGLATLVVASIALGRSRLAERARSRMNPRDVVALARLHRRAAVGRFVTRDECDSDGGMLDEAPSLLDRIAGVASRALDEAIAVHPEYADLRFHRANCLARLDLAEDALADLDAAIEVNPSYGMAQRLRERINDRLRADRV
ncbi:MAG: hypothetical protein ACF8PN_03625 [Phycisphaerales bacterium]